MEKFVVFLPTSASLTDNPLIIGEGRVGLPFTSTGFSIFNSNPHIPDFAELPVAPLPYLIVNPSWG